MYLVLPRQRQRLSAPRCRKLMNDMDEIHILNACRMDYRPFTYKTWYNCNIYYMIIYSLLHYEI